jgi:hypothetical protein
MSLDFYQLFQLISEGISHIPDRQQTRQLRKNGLSTCLNNSEFNKVAFDTRRIDQEMEYNPRRGLQNYNRSEAFLSDVMGQKVKNLVKLRDILAELKDEYGKEHEWQDSNTRVLLSTLDSGLRTLQKDGDYSENQPSLGSFDYIEELLHVRYRLTFDDLVKKGSSELKKIILSKDEELIRKDINHSLQITKADIGSKSYDTLMDKLFNIQASEEHPEIERTISITIKDKIVK